VAEVSFTDAALDDLRRLGPDVVPKVLKKIVILLDDPEAGHPLGGSLTGFRKLVVGRNHWRVVYRLTDDGVVEICEIWCVGARSDSEVYAEAAARVAKAPGDDPALRRLADVINVLGQRVARVEAVWPQQSRGEPVPDWLADRLVHTAGMAAEKVAALNLEQAVDLWTQFANSPRD
jgi:mRNA interferase RelE/StbE